MKGDVLCPDCARYYRRRVIPRCVLCGRRLIGPMSLSIGECYPGCEERAADEAMAAALVNSRYRKRRDAKPLTAAPSEGTTEGP